MIDDWLLRMKPNTSVYIVFGISALIIIFDLITPPEILLNYLFILPVIIIGWHKGFRWACGFSLALPMIRLLIVTWYEPIFTLQFNLINATIRITLLLAVAKLSTKFSLAVNKIKTLEGMLPICSNCKKIRDAHDVWQPIESYIQKHSQATFTHGMCPECTQELFGSFIKKS